MLAHVVDCRGTPQLFYGLNCNLSDKLGPNWELGPNCAAAANSVGIGWESGSPKTAWEPQKYNGILGNLNNQCFAPQVKSSQVMCIYTGTHQLFPTHVLARRRSPGTVVRVRYRFTLHISRSISLSFIHHYLWFGFAGDTILVYPILRCLSYLPHYLPLLPDVTQMSGGFCY